MGKANLLIDPLFCLKFVRRDRKPKRIHGRGFEKSSFRFKGVTLWHAARSYRSCARRKITCSKMYTFVDKPG